MTTKIGDDASVIYQRFETLWGIAIPDYLDTIEDFALQRTGRTWHYSYDAKSIGETLGQLVHKPGFVVAAPTWIGGGEHK